MPYYAYNSPGDVLWLWINQVKTLPSYANYLGNLHLQKFTIHFKIPRRTPSIETHEEDRNTNGFVFITGLVYLYIHPCVLKYMQNNMYFKDFFSINLVCICVMVNMKQSVNNFRKSVSFLLLPCGFQGSNSNHEAWRQAPAFPAEPSHRPYMDFSCSRVSMQWPAWEAHFEQSPAPL